MTSAEAGWRRNARALCVLAALACARLSASGQGVHAPAFNQQLVAARTSYYAAVDGKKVADSDAVQRFASLESQHPHDPTIGAYNGSLKLFQASQTAPLLRKHSLSVEGLRQMDAAVDADPNNLEVRFVRALTTRNLPFFFGRKQQSEADLMFLGPRSEQAARSGALPPNLAAAALDFYGHLLKDQHQQAAALQAFSAAVRVDRQSPAGADALKRLR